MPGPLVCRAGNSGNANGARASARPGALRASVDISRSLLQLDKSRVDLPRGRPAAAPASQRHFPSRRLPPAAPDLRGAMPADRLHIARRIGVASADIATVSGGLIRVLSMCSAPTTSPAYAREGDKYPATHSGIRATLVPTGHVDHVNAGGCRCCASSISRKRGSRAAARCRRQRPHRGRLRCRFHRRRHEAHYTGRN